MLSSLSFHIARNTHNYYNIRFNPYDIGFQTNNPLGESPNILPSVYTYFGFGGHFVLWRFQGRSLNVIIRYGATVGISSHVYTQSRRNAKNEFTSINKGISFVGISVRISIYFGNTITSFDRINVIRWKSGELETSPEM